MLSLPCSTLYISTSSSSKALASSMARYSSSSTSIKSTKVFRVSHLIRASSLKLSLGRAFKVKSARVKILQIQQLRSKKSQHFKGESQPYE
ncbi:hypothetical protein SUGI_0447710 [Cryptomeria japonica]|nr:hypothetical protein SUGI_0447710 [Cryptomeria japonica]